ncbi:MAG TPA: dihydroxy-acid dehydratase [Gammaproteobacteria bacterium]|nr:dihydroxy-acid dehydratase [Gammaproteobacteria bacterium]
MSKVAISSVKEGDEYSFTVNDFNRTQFVKYAGGGGDFNPIHHDQTFAEKAGLETVFGMGLLTAGILSRVPVEWFGPTTVHKYNVQFRERLWPGDNVEFKGVVAKTYEKDGVAYADLTLSATNQDGKPLILSTATVRDQ